MGPARTIGERRKAPGARDFKSGMASTAGKTFSKKYLADPQNTLKRSFAMAQGALSIHLLGKKAEFHTVAWQKHPFSIHLLGLDGLVHRTLTHYYSL